MEIHSSILTWRTSWTEEPSGLQSMEVTKSQTSLSDQHFNTRRKKDLNTENDKVLMK